MPFFNTIIPIISGNSGWPIPDGTPAEMVAVIKQARAGATEITLPVLDDLRIPDHAFDGCTKLRKVTFPAGTSGYIIGESAFNGCANLRTIVNDMYIGCIKTKAFYGCNSFSLNFYKLWWVYDDAFDGDDVSLDFSNVGSLTIRPKAFEGMTHVTINTGKYYNSDAPWGANSGTLKYSARQSYPYGWYHVSKTIINGQLM